MISFFIEILYFVCNSLKLLVKNKKTIQKSLDEFFLKDVWKIKIVFRHWLTNNCNIPSFYLVICSKVSAMKLCARSTSGLRLSVRTLRSSNNKIDIEKIVCFRSMLDRCDNTIVCFYYVIPYYCEILFCEILLWRVLLGISPSMSNQKETPARCERLYAVTVEIKKRLILEGSLMIIYASLVSWNLAISFIQSWNATRQLSSVNYIFKQIDRCSFFYRRRSIHEFFC